MSSQVNHCLVSKLALNHSVVASLKYFDNRFLLWIGHIPTQMGQLATLRALKLSSNALTGTSARMFGNVAAHTNAN